VSNLALKTVGDPYDRLRKIGPQKEDEFFLETILEKVSDLCPLSHGVCAQVEEDSPLKASLEKINEVIVTINRLGLVRGEDFELRAIRFDDLLKVECDREAKRAYLVRQIRDSFGDVDVSHIPERWLFDGEEMDEDTLAQNVNEFCDERGYPEVGYEVLERIKTGKPSAGGNVVEIGRKKISDVLVECLTE
jgi:hypothetical protein